VARRRSRALRLPPPRIIGGPTSGVPARRFLLLRTRDEAQLGSSTMESRLRGAWDERWWHEANVIPRWQKASPRPSLPTRRAHFLIRMVRKYPTKLLSTKRAMTNLALAISLDPSSELAQNWSSWAAASLTERRPEFANNPARIQFLVRSRAAQICASVRPGGKLSARRPIFR